MVGLFFVVSLQSNQKQYIMTLEEAVWETANKDVVYTETLAKLLENTVIAKALFNKNKGNDPWRPIHKQFGVEYFNPNFTIMAGNVFDKMKELSIDSPDNYYKAFRDAVNIVNKKAKRTVFEFEPHRLTRYHKINWA